MCALLASIAFCIPSSFQRHHLPSAPNAVLKKSPVACAVGGLEGPGIIPGAPCSYRPHPTCLHPSHVTYRPSLPPSRNPDSRLLWVDARNAAASVIHVIVCAVHPACSSRILRACIPPTSPTLVPQRRAELPCECCGWVDVRDEPDIIDSIDIVRRGPCSHRPHPACLHPSPITYS